jgi:hypothetical protein
LPNATQCLAADHARSVTMSDSPAEFRHAERGLARNPPNIETITVEYGALHTWLVARRNDVELRFPLREADCRHLAALLLDMTALHSLKGPH